MELKEEGGERLDPVGDELAVGRLAYLAGLRVEAEALGPSAGHAGGVHVGSARADGGERLGDTAGDELVVARCLRTLAPLDLSPQCSQARRQDSPRGRSSVKTGGLSLPRRALVALGSVTGRALGSVQLDPSVDVLGLRTPRLGSADSRHPPRLASQSDALAQ
jgi:hypothetical protein